MGICDNNKNDKNHINNKGFIPKINGTTIINDNVNFDKNNPKQNDITNIKEESEKNNHEIPITSEESEKIIRQSKIYICKIYIPIGKGRYGTGFLCKIPFPDKNNYLPVLMTNNHVINKEQLLKYKKLELTFDNGKIKKIINTTPERRIYSIKEDHSYDLTIIEIFPEEDNIFHFFEIEAVDVTEKFENESIYILQYPFIEEVDKGIKIKRHNCSISYGKIIKVNNNEILHDCSTENGSSGGPILLLKNFKIIGIHKCYYNHVNKYKNMDVNAGASLKEPIENFNLKFTDKKIKNNYTNCIICEYNIKNNEEFDLLHDYNNQNLGLTVEFNKLYNKGKNKKILLEKNINIFIDDQLIKFSYKYKTNKNKINVKFIFHEKINDLSFIFYKCKYLQHIDLSPFNAINVNNMSYMFGECESLKSIDFFSFNTSNVTNMAGMFSGCESLETIDLSSFDTKNVTHMNEMFYYCSSIKRLDLTKFNTINVVNMNKMFYSCFYLKFLYFNSFKTDNVIDMAEMFNKCSSLKSLDLSNFNTSKVINMDGMFGFCSKLEYINIKSFNTNNVTNMKMMFASCMSLKSLDLSSFNTINVKNMNQMFSGGYLLESLDLSSFNTMNTIDMGGMFTQCLALKNIKTNDKNILKIKNMKINLPSELLKY